ncbi:MAG: NAD(P)/FAD-dependent oxidoreductase [Desulfobulbus sp.]|nr:MAG: NAD(P)/FAD-dependent oxidoreductase [Desulfobulbus sp.]
MADYQLVIIGGGLSGLAAGIRSARFGQKTLIVEQHHRPGGLNSYYHRQGFLLETGLHAMTNFAPTGEKHAPLNRLFRQLKLSRKRFITHEQLGSEIIFPGVSLKFSNDLELLCDEIGTVFPAKVDSFLNLVKEVEAYDPFAEVEWRSTRDFLLERLGDPLLIDMLLLPLMVYGNAEEHDMDLGQFAIMFRALFLEGFFRPEGTIRDLLAMLTRQYEKFDGELRLNTPVAAIMQKNKRVLGIRLADGEEITADAVLSTAGIPATARLSGWDIDEKKYIGQMSFMETISMVPRDNLRQEQTSQTILFYNLKAELAYKRPETVIDPSWGVICFPENFHGLQEKLAKNVQVRVTNAANYTLWQAADADEYRRLKEECCRQSAESVAKIIGNYRQDVVYQDSFTPMTIERFTAKSEGAVYGSPIKIKSGRTPWSNLFIAGTDQGYLGIVGSMLSGVTIVNQHLLG